MNDLENVSERVTDLEATVYKGNGRPSLLARMEVNEKRDSDQDGKLRDLENSQQRWEKIAVKLALSVIGAVITVVGRIIWEAVNH